MYHYAGNNPVKYTDPDGREAGDLFESLDDAAKDFAITYNDDSIRCKKELASYIRKKHGKYVYDIPHAGNEGHVKLLRSSSETDIAAMIHTHGAYFSRRAVSENLYEERALEPSNGDFDEVNRTHLSSYIVTPDGALYLLKYDEVKSSIACYIYKAIYPSDSNCPVKKNNNDSEDYPENFYYTEAEYNRMHGR